MYRIWVSVFGLGYSPLIPGTCGSAAALAAFLAVALLSRSDPLTAAVMLLVALLGFIVTIVYGDRAIERYGPDASVIVSDELCGQAITYLALWPLPAADREIVVLAVVGFILFRILDILKPPPARQFERIKGAWGVLLDDVMAGIYANVLLQLLWRCGALSFLLG